MRRGAETVGRLKVTMLYWASENKIISTDGWCVDHVKAMREEYQLSYSDRPGRHLIFWITMLGRDHSALLCIDRWLWQPDETPIAISDRATVIENIVDSLALQNIWVRRVQNVRVAASLRPAAPLRGEVRYQGDGVIRWDVAGRSLTVKGYEDSHGRMVIPSSLLDRWDPPHEFEELTATDRDHAIVALGTWLEDRGQSLLLTP